MKTFAVTLASAAAVVASLSYTRPAHALGPVDVEVAARTGYATNPSSADFGSNPYGGGLGGRAGVSIFGIYGGVSGIYYFGSSPAPGVTIHTGMYGFEFGYTLPVPFVKIRPEVGIGNSTIAESGFSSSNLYLEPGVLVMVPFGHFFAGADVNALILPSVSVPSVEGPSSSKSYVSLSLHAQFGVKF